MVNADQLIRLSSKTILKPVWGHLLLLLAIRRVDPYNFSYPLLGTANSKAKARELLKAIFSILSTSKLLTLWFWILTLRTINQIGHRLVMNPLPPRKIQWRNQVVVVSGGARGIMGRTVEYLTDRGAKVVAVDLADHSQNGRESLYIKADVTDEKALLEARERIVKKFGKIT